MSTPQHDEDDLDYTSEPDYELMAERLAEESEAWATRDWNIWGDAK